MATHQPGGETKPRRVSSDSRQYSTSYVARIYIHYVTVTSTPPHVHTHHVTEGGEITFDEHIFSTTAATAAPPNRQQVFNYRKSTQRKCTSSSVRNCTAAEALAVAPLLDRVDTREHWGWEGA